jgi:mono/diheme cytochrome c family protein
MTMSTLAMTFWRESIRSSLAACAPALLILLSPATGFAQPTERQPATDSVIAWGARVYRGSANCVACHGPTGRGTADGPSLADGTWLKGRGTYEELIQQVVHGVPRRESVTGKPMPMRGWAGATDDEIRAVAAYVWSISRPAARTP